ncbi:hypothetical protein GMLC_10570 [Geomonas limicola]|uniref:Uncharacterized protein n=1 Tax=Geomonas limicola TaxID=2740186 RepID=A0A6V8N4I2_9BACT|nr:hypothetical protein [Geomonas limicola]GFO67478.1 hypothetical protein GMLC_10570 [Geomonas limicola]
MRLLRAFLVGAGRHCLAAAKPALIGRILRKLDTQLHVPRIDLLTYPEAVRIALHHLPQAVENARGVLVKRPDPTGFLFIWLYLDADCKPVLGADGQLVGKKLLISRLDEELDELFGDNDMIHFA